MNYIWICFTDKLGIVLFDGEYSITFIQQLLKLKGCKDYEIHLADNSTYLFFLQNYLEDCLQLEYTKEV